MFLCIGFLDTPKSNRLSDSQGLLFYKFHKIYLQFFEQSCLYEKAEVATQSPIAELY